MGNDIKWQNSRIIISQLLDAHSWTYTCQETMLHEYFCISVYSGFSEHIVLATGLKDDWTATLQVEPSRERKVYSLPRATFISQGIYEIETIFLFPREDLFTIESKGPSLHMQRGKRTECQLCHISSKFHNFRVCLLWYKTPLYT